jgi:CRP/FNR family transcriptional regulator
VISKDSIVPHSCADCKDVGDSFFCELKHQELDEISINKTHKTYKKGQQIFLEGGFSSGLYCIKEGKIKIHKLGDLGKDQIVRLASKGDILGYRSLLSNEVYKASATAMSNATVCKISKQAFNNILSKNNQLLFKTIQHLTQDLKGSEEKMMNMAQKPVRERIAESILLLRNAFGTVDNGNLIDVSITRKEISEIAGSTTETTIRTISSFAKDGIIETIGKRIKVLNFKKLVSIANVLD